MTIRTWLAPWSSCETINARATTKTSPTELVHVYSKTKLVITILLFRACYLSALAISCHFVPEHNPGDDVLRFDMRLNHNIDCYCIEGHACDDRTQFSTYTDNSLSACAIPSISGSIVPPSVWNFLLAPLTKWDAARFLNLAANPFLRDPQQSKFLSSSPSAHSWDNSEQAHAFFPMFPLVIRQLALFLLQNLPPQILPPTFESLVVLSGMIFNNLICLTVATVALYDLTLVVMKSGDPTRLQEERKQYHHLVAVVVCLVFGVWNPALVFFATNYSESLFAASTILGHLCMQLSKNEGSVILWFIGIFSWMIGSYTRSNGILHSLWLLQDGLSHMLLVLRHNNSGNEKCKSNTTVSFSTKSAFGEAIIITIQSIVGAIFVAIPGRYHDINGWKRHCVGSGLRPLWCEYSDKNASVLGPSFSLYRYVQVKHWNVGLFRYYEWKQIPNFLLAAPILALSIAGVYRWIHWALITVYGKGKFPSSLSGLLIGWPKQALPNSVSSAGIASKSVSPTLSSERYLLIENPRLLGHYAILGILVFLGFLIAHIQISTRMICSTSPAITWFIAYCLLSSSSSTTGTKPVGHEQEMNQYFLIIIDNLQSVIWFYVGLYMSLGMILHVNFLPWT